MILFAETAAFSELKLINHQNLELGIHT